jgi:hypothetical protein
MMTEVSRLWFLVDTDNIRFRPRYIISAANISVDQAFAHKPWQQRPIADQHLQKHH